MPAIAGRFAVLDGGFLAAFLSRFWTFRSSLLFFSGWFVLPSTRLLLHSTIRYIYTMASAKEVASAPLPAFVVERMKLWDELRAAAQEAAAGTFLCYQDLDNQCSHIDIPFIYADRFDLQPFLKYQSRLPSPTDLKRMVCPIRPLLSMLPCQLPRDWLKTLLLPRYAPL